MAGSVTRDKICEAAIRAASRDGVLAMTLDNVAREAGVSKGGVMYHFPTKDELISGMLDYFGRQCEQMLLARIAADPDPENRWARNMLDCLFPGPSGAPAAIAREGFRSGLEGAGAADAEALPRVSATNRPGDGGVDLSAEVIDRFMLSALAAAVNNPRAFEGLAAVGTRLRERLLSDPNGGLDQLLIWLAVDGLFLWQFVGMIRRDDPLFDQIGAALREKVASRQTRGERPGAAVQPDTGSSEEARSCGPNVNDVRGDRATMPAGGAA